MKLNRDFVKNFLNEQAAPANKESYVCSQLGISYGTYLRRCKDETRRGWSLEQLIALGCVLGQIAKRKPIDPNELIVIDNGEPETPENAD